MLYQVIDIRCTQSGWVMDGYLTPASTLPVSIPFDYQKLYAPGFCFNAKRLQIKSLFEQELSKLYNENRRNHD